MGIAIVAQRPSRTNARLASAGGAGWCWLTPVAALEQLGPGDSALGRLDVLPTLPVTIFVFSESPDPGEQANGWAAALVLIAFVLVLNIVAKVFAGWRRRSLEGG